jgi:hypothetical protein
MLYSRSTERKLEEMLTTINTTSYSAEAAPAAAVPTWQTVGARFELDLSLPLAGRRAR